MNETYIPGYKRLFFSDPAQLPYRSIGIYTDSLEIAQRTLNMNARHEIRRLMPEMRYERIPQQMVNDHLAEFGVIYREPQKDSSQNPRS